MNQKPLLTISQFAELALLSTKALRLYDERGLLRPAAVDPFSGYRFYRAEQASRGRFISLLRSAGMPLNLIEEVLAVSDSEAAAEIERYQRQLTAGAASACTVLEQARAHLTGGIMSKVQRSIQPEQPVLSALLRTTVEALDEGMEATLAVLQERATASGVTVSGPAFGIFHAPISEESNGPLEVCLPIQELPAQLASGQSVTHDPEVRAYALAGGSFASVEVSGAETSYPAILAAYDQACEWIESEGKQRVGRPREIWHVLPWAEEPARMTISWPYA